MPRGRKRNQPKRTADTPRNGESLASRKARLGTIQYGYKYRIRGPQFPVTTTHIDDG
ncbi:MAG: hypothetical protein ABFR89_02575 [Actinomycetota bacterium]